MPANVCDGCGIYLGGIAAKPHRLELGVDGRSAARLDLCVRCLEPVELAVRAAPTIPTPAAPKARRRAAVAS